MILAIKNGLVSLQGKNDEVRNYQPVGSDTDFRRILYESLTPETQIKISDAVRNCLPLLEAVVADFPKSAAEYWAKRLLEGKGSFFPIPDKMNSFGEGENRCISATWGQGQEDDCLILTEVGGLEVRAVHPTHHEMFAYFDANGGVIKQYDAHRDVTMRCKFWGYLHQPDNFLLP